MLIVADGGYDIVILGGGSGGYACALRAAELTEPKKPIIISLNRDGEVFIGDERVGGDELEPRLAQLAAEDASRIVYVRSDRTNSYAQVMDTLGLVNRAGFSKVSLIAEAAAQR